MLTVSDFGLILRKSRVDKQSICSIDKELGHSRKTLPSGEQLRLRKSDVKNGGS
jgi:hypothetical protein